MSWKDWLGMVFDAEQASNEAFELLKCGFPQEYVENIFDDFLIKLEYELRDTISREQVPNSGMGY